MKELTIEQKAQRYDKAIKKLRDFYRDYDTVSRIIDVKEELANLFPELKESSESKDERIRKVISDILLIDSDEIRKILDVNNLLMQDIDAWLEKQRYKDKLIQELEEYKIKVTCPICGWEIEKQGEKTANKAKPKFKVGDWIVYKDNIWKVCNISLKAYYELLNINNEVIIRHFEGVDKTAHLWTIQDAKDGDILSYNNGKWIFIVKNIEDISVNYYVLLYDKNELTFNCGGETTLIETITPATKEEQRLLFRKIREAGYEWDAEKKKLKKIESYSLRSIIKDEPSPAIKKVVDSLTKDEKIEQAYNVETQKSVEWEPQTGDTFRKKGTTSPTYHLCGKREDGITFVFVENREVGISGGEISTFTLKQDYELVERPKPIEKVVEEEFNKALQTKVEQKTAWSEEDERNLNDAILFIKTGTYSLDKDNLINWLKSLKDRVQPQPKQESLKSITAHCDYSEYEDWT